MEVCMNAISVIGGADGPTAVFVTGMNPTLFVAAIALAVVLIAGLVWWLVSKIKNRKK